MFSKKYFKNILKFVSEEGRIKIFYKKIFYNHIILNALFDLFEHWNTRKNINSFISKNYWL